MTFTFTPPVTHTVPPTLPEEHKGNRLMRFFRPRPEGVNVYLYKAGSLSAIRHGRVDETDPITLYDSNGVATTNGWDDVELVFWGGHEAVVITTAQAQALQAGGYTVEEIAPPEPDPPVTSSLSPSTGAIGTACTILGTNMSEVTTVSVNGISISFNILSSTAITFTVPAGDDTEYEVTVENAYGTSDPLTFTIVTPEVGDPPTISVISPSSGSVGITVTLTGLAFDDVTSVTVDGTPVSFNIASPTSITYTAPAHADGVATIVVTNPYGTDDATFTYTTGVSDPHPGADILLESGDFLLLEDGTSSLLLE